MSMKPHFVPSVTDRRFVTQADLEESIEVVIAGYQKKNAILTNKEKLIVSYHEIGHALVAAKQSRFRTCYKRSRLSQELPVPLVTLCRWMKADHYLMSKEELENKIATFTGGRAAEEVIFGSVTTGASNDIEQATKPCPSHDHPLRYERGFRYGCSGDCHKPVSRR